LTYTTHIHHTDWQYATSWLLVTIIVSTEIGFDVEGGLHNIIMLMDICNIWMAGNGKSLLIFWTKWVKNCQNHWIGYAAAT